MKKILSMILAVAMMVTLCVMLSSCTSSSSSALTVGVILVGDETEGYTLTHMQAIEAAVAALKAKGMTVNYQYKKCIPEDSSVETNAKDLIADGCTLIITNSYGHQFHFGDVIETNPNVQFVSMTGDLAHGSGLSNYHNAFTGIYEARYVSGIVAGLKLKELLDSGKLSPEAVPTAYDADGNIKIGYVGAFDYQEIVSGYTAFFLGIKSIVPNIAMTVKYTNSWFSEEKEAAVAEYLMSIGCVIIGQHADSTGAPAAVEKAYKADNSLVCYSVGYNVSMLDCAPDVALTSPTNHWNVYYETLFESCIKGTALASDWAEGYAKDVVSITELGKACAEGTQAKVDEAIAAIKAGTLKVFDCSTFTVNGANLTSYTGAYNMDGAECIKTANGITYFEESVIRSAPYFDIRIDGITEIAAD